MNKNTIDLLPRLLKLSKEDLFFKMNGQNYTFEVAIFPLSRNETVQVRACNYKKGDAHLTIDFNFTFVTVNSPDGYRIEILSFNNLNSVNFTPDLTRRMSEEDLRVMLESIPIIKRTFDNLS